MVEKEKVERGEIRRSKKRMKKEAGERREEKNEGKECLDGGGRRGGRSRKKWEEGQR